MADYLAGQRFFDFYTEEHDDDRPRAHARAHRQKRRAWRGELMGAGGAHGSDRWDGSDRSDERGTARRMI